jgi:hypothetical protein
MGVVVSTTATSPFFLVSGIIGMVSFAFTLGTFFKVVWTNLSTLTEAKHEVHSYLTNLRQELLEERTSLKFLKKACKKRPKSRDSRYGRDVRDYLDLQLDAATIKTMSDAVRHMIKQFQVLEKPFLEPGEEGIQQATSSSNSDRRSRRRGDSRSPYYTHSAYRSSSYEKKRARGPSDNEDYDDQGDAFWPQRVRYCDFTLHRRFQWLRRKGSAQRLFEDLSRMQTRRTARQVGGIALMMNDFAGTMARMDDSLGGIEDRLQRVVGVRRFD